ncbi:unnamed protein product [Phaeothamnion confervicola]
MSLFSPSGRLAPRSFAVAVLAVYVLSFLSQALLSAAVTGRAGLWPFAVLQALLIWTWFAVHARRLRDAGRSSGFALGIACLYALAMVLLLLVMVMITATDSSSEAAQTGQGLLHLFAVLYVLGVLLGSSDFGVLGYWLVGFLALILTPVAIALGFSIWAGTRPSVPPSP